MSENTGLLQQLFDEVASFNFEECNAIVGTSPDSLLCEDELNATTIVVKIKDEDFESRNQFSGITPWSLFFVNRDWYNLPENPEKFGRLFPAAIVCSLSQAVYKRPFSYLDADVRTKLGALSDKFYFVMPIKCIKTRTVRGWSHRVTLSYVGGNYFTPGNYEMQNLVLIRDIVLFGKPVSGLRRTNLASMNSYIPRNLTMDYLNALIAVKDFVNTQAYAESEGGN